MRDAGSPRFAGLLPAREEECTLTLNNDFRNAAVGVSLGGFWRIAMAISMTRRAALIGLSTGAALPAGVLPFGLRWRTGSG